MNPPPLLGDPNRDDIKALKRRGFINQGSTLGVWIRSGFRDRGRARILMILEILHSQDIRELGSCRIFSIQP